MGLLNYDRVVANRYDMYSVRAPFMEKWADSAEVMSPRRFNQDGRRRNAGESKEQKIVNNVARRALRTFVSGMSNGATPRSREWFRLTTRNHKLRNHPAVKIYFRELENILNSYFQLGNLYRVLPSSYKDLGVFSNSAFGMLPHAQYAFYFHPFSMGSYGMSSDSEGNTNQFFRDFNMTVRQVVERYLPLKSTGHINWEGKDPWLKNAWENAEYTNQVLLSNVIIPNPSPVEKPFFPHDKAFQSYTYINATGVGPNAVPQTARARSNADGNYLDDFLSINGYSYFPVITPRWEVAPESDYGDDGPGEIALGDTMTLQEMEIGRLNALDKLLRPAFVGPSSLRRHEASILAGGITYIDEMVPGKQFRPAFTVDPKLAELIATSADYEQKIKSAFFEDLFLMLASERPISHVTKEEIQQRQAEKLTAIGPVMGQLDQDQNRPIIENALLILEQAGNVLPKKPDVLEGEEFQIEYVNILAQAQKTSSVVSTERFVNFSVGASQALQDPALLGLIKGDKMLRSYAEDIGFDPRFLRDEAEYEKIKAAIIQAQRIKAQAEMANQNSETARNLSQSNPEEPAA